MSRDPNKARPNLQLRAAQTTTLSAPPTLAPALPSADHDADHDAPPALPVEVVWDEAALPPEFQEAIRIRNGLKSFSEFFPLELGVKAIWFMYSELHDKPEERRKRLAYAIYTLIEQGDDWLALNAPATARELVKYALDNPWTDAQEKALLADPLAELLDDALQNVYDAVNSLRKMIFPLLGGHE